MQLKCLDQNTYFIHVHRLFQSRKYPGEFCQIGNVD